MIKVKGMGVMGMIMGRVMVKFCGRVDGKFVSFFVRKKI